MRVCIVYDCLYPWTVGGGERWLRQLAEALAGSGTEVTYVTRLQWDPAEPPDIPGVRVVAVAPDEPLYGPDGQRRIPQALRFGRGVLGHLLRHGRDYDVVHVAAFPYFSLLAAGLARRVGRYRIISDWFEVWSQEYWRAYLGGVKGRAADLVQRACAHVPQDAFCLSELHGRRLEAIGLRGSATVLRGLWGGTLERPDPEPGSGEVVYAGRLIAEKRAPALARAILDAGLRGAVVGGGPELEAVAAIAAQSGGRLRAPGFVERDELDATIRAATCVALASSREGYGLLCVEAFAAGVPVVVVAGPDNAATELVEEGVNGFIAPSLDALGHALQRVEAAGPALRESTADWFAAHAGELTIARSLERVLAAYGRA